MWRGFLRLSAVLALTVPTVATAQVTLIDQIPVLDRLGLVLLALMVTAAALLLLRRSG